MAEYSYLHECADAVNTENEIKFIDLFVGWAHSIIHFKNWDSNVSWHPTYIDQQWKITK